MEVDVGAEYTFYKTVFGMRWVEWSAKSSFAFLFFSCGPKK